MKHASQSNYLMEVPEGFELLDRGSPFLAMVGPLYCKRNDDGTPVFGLRVGPQHANVKGMAHGGMLMTMADTALAIAIAFANDEKPMVTVNLSTDFVEAAHPGDWVEAHVDVQRIGSRLAFANCYLIVGERRILRASGVFASSSGQRR